jgi:hypothetical protein
MATIAQTDTDVSTADAATYNYNTAGGTALSIGADGGNDVIYIGAGARTTANASTATVTVDGVTADLIVQHNFDEGGGVRSLAGIWAIDRNDLPDASQTDVDVAITYNAGCIRNAAAIALSADAVKTATATATQDAGSAGNLNLNVPSLGVVMGFVFQGDNGTFTWSGLTEETDADVESGSYSSAYASNASAETPRSVDVSPSATDLSASVAASFAAAAVAGGASSYGTIIG